MSSGFTLDIAGRHLIVFSPFENDKVPALIEERVRHVYCDNYEPIHSVVCAYLSQVQAESDRGLLELVGDFHEVMAAIKNSPHEHYIKSLCTLHDLIEDDPALLTKPIHDQFYARLHQLLRQEEYIHPTQYASYRGYVETYAE